MQDWKTSPKRNTDANNIPNFFILSSVIFGQNLINKPLTFILFVCNYTKITIFCQKQFLVFHQSLFKQFDETYTGTLVQGKQTTPHFKLKEREDKPSSEWIRVEGTHEAIIQKHDFDLVQRLRRIDTRTSPKSDKVYLFSGILICGCCGCRMTRKTNRYKDKEYHYYYCPTGKKNGCTSSVMLKESDLIECVQDSLKGHIENVASLDALLSSISQERINRELAQEYAAQIRVNEKRVAQTEGFKAKLYENLVSGILTKEEFLSYKRKYNADIELFQKAIVEWNDKLTDVLENRSERNRWINHFMKFSTMEDIDRRAVMQLIRSIRVMGKDELHIEFNYQDEYQKAISLAEQIATKMKKGWWAKWQEKAENRRQRLCRHHLYMYMWLCISVFLWRITKAGLLSRNQKLVLNDFLSDKPDFVVYDTYIDNGATGTNFHRLDFRKCYLILKQATLTV